MDYRKAKQKPATEESRSLLEKWRCPNKLSLTDAQLTISASNKHIFVGETPRASRAIPYIQTDGAPNILFTWIPGLQEELVLAYTYGTRRASIGRLIEHTPNERSHNSSNSSSVTASGHLCRWAAAWPDDGCIMTCCNLELTTCRYPSWSTLKCPSFVSLGTSSSAAAVRW